MSMDRPDADRLRSTVTASMQEHWVLFLVEGIILVILGLAAIIVPPLATLAVAIFIGWLFLISGIVGLVTTFWMRHAPGFWWSLLSAVLGIVAGIVLIGSPVSGAISLTLVLIVFFIIEGVASIMFALEHRAGAFRALGMDVGERHRRSRSRRYHLRRPAVERRMGARPSRRHQFSVRRLGARRHGAARPLTGFARREIRELKADTQSTIFGIRSGLGHADILQ